MTEPTAHPIHWQRHGRSGLKAFTVTPGWDLTIERNDSGYGVWAYRINEPSRAPIMVAWRALQRAAKADAVKWVAEMTADAAEAQRACLEAVEAPSHTACGTRSDWSVELTEGRRRLALARAQDEAAAEDTERTVAADAREAYAHALYQTRMTTAEITAGYADWDAGNYGAVEKANAYRVGDNRRAVLARLSELATAGRAAPWEALDAYARGEFRRALSWLRDDVLRDLDNAPSNEAPEMTTDLESFVAFIDAQARRAKARRAKARRQGPLCLRTGGAHVGHMAAVDAECLTMSPEMDAYDAAAEAVSATSADRF